MGKVDRAKKDKNKNDPCLGRYWQVSLALDPHFPMVPSVRLTNVTL